MFEINNKHLAEYLAKFGWSPARRCDVSEWEAYFKKSGSPLSESALYVLQCMGNLHIINDPSEWPEYFRHKYNQKLDWIKEQKSVFLNVPPFHGDDILFDPTNVEIREYQRYYSNKLVKQIGDNPSPLATDDTYAFPCEIVISNSGEWFYMAESEIIWLGSTVEQSLENLLFGTGPYLRHYSVEY